LRLAPTARSVTIRQELPLDAARKPPGRPQMMRKFLFLFAAVAALAVAVDSFLIEPYRIEVTHSSVQAPLARALKIAHLSDLHTSGLGRRELKLLSLLDAEHPDVIVITGDTVTRGNHYDNIRPLLSRLHAPLGVWLVRGNWENDYPLHNERAFYSQLGIHFLLNEARLIRSDIWLAGLDDPSRGTPNLDAALSTVPQGAYVIAAVHAPAFFDSIAGRVPPRARRAHARRTSPFAAGTGLLAAPRVGTFPGRLVRRARFEDVC
jgi:predicted MPP superfamily phosphohydrolase